MTLTMMVAEQVQSSEGTRVRELFGTLGRRRESRNGVAVLELRQPGALSENDLAALHKLLTPLAERIFRGDWSRHFEGERQRRTFKKRRRFYVVVSETDHVVGWSGYYAKHVGRDTLLYFDIAAVDADHRSSGVFGDIYGRAIAQEWTHRPWNRMWVVGFTQNPVVYAMQLHTLGRDNVYPKAVKR